MESLLVLPVGVFMFGCSSGTAATYSTAGAGADPPGAPPTVSGSQAVYTSSNVEGHTHTFAIELEDLASATKGVSGETSEDEQHTHTVELSDLNLKSIQNGSTLKVTTSSNEGHSHVFTFVRVV